MEIRRYRRGEEEQVWKVYFAATRVSVARDYHAELIERWAPEKQDMNEWAERVAEKNPFVAVVEREILGMAEIEGDGFIDYFYVHPDWQGRGVGKALLRRIEDEAEQLGVKRMYADVSVTAKDFFLAMGFEILEAKENVILGHPAPNFRMEKDIAVES